MSAMSSQITSITIVYLNRLFRHRSKKTSKLRVTDLCVRGIHRWPVYSPHKGPVTRKMFSLDDIIMVFYEEGLQQPVPSQRWGMSELPYLEWLSTYKQGGRGHDCCWLTVVLKPLHPWEGWIQMGTDGSHRARSSSSAYFRKYLLQAGHPRHHDLREHHLCDHR